MLADSLTAEAPAPPSSLYLVEEINHRVINEYSEAIATLSLAAARIDSEEAKASLAGAAERLRDHAALHRALLPPFTQGTANLADYLAQMCQSFAKASLAGKEVRLVLKAEDMLLTTEKCWRIGLIVSELVRNAVRHGLKGKSGTILVRIDERQGRIAGMVCDDGTAKADSLPGRGQKLIRALVADLDGTIEWSLTREGSHARMLFPRDEEVRPARPVRANADN